MTRWAAFAGISVAVLGLLLALARASQSVVTDGAADATPAEATGADDTHDGLAAGDGATDDGASSEGAPVDSMADRRASGPPFVRDDPRSPRRAEPSARLLLLNVAVSQGLLAAVLVGGAWYAQVPPGALGLTSRALGSQLAVGIGFGLALVVANTAGAALAEALGSNPSKELRKLLAPDSVSGWALLLVVVLPVIAGFEELLFRAALVGGFAAGFGLSPWLLAVLSSAAFAVGHGAQGTAGVIVTGLLGFVLAAGFVLTGSLLVVVVAHYLVNAAEFVIYEGLKVAFP